MQNYNYRRSTTTCISDIVEVKNIIAGSMVGAFAIAIVGAFMLLH